MMETSIPAQTRTLDPSLTALFWGYVYKRQQAFENRRKGKKPPWTADPVLAKYRFTNPYRAADRVSQYLIREVLYTPYVLDASQDPAELAFRAVLFRIFNQPETYHIFKHFLVEHPSLANWNVRDYTQILDNALDTSEVAIWNNAYMITPPLDTYGTGEGKHAGWLRILDRMVQDRAFQRIAETHNRAAVYKLLLSYPTVGPFFAMQWTTDIGYANIPSLNGVDENSFVVPGGGAHRGARKLLSGYSNPPSTGAVIRFLTANQETYFTRLGLDFPYLGGSRRLSWMDIQNCLCEFDKYLRVVRPDLTHGKMYTQIKQRFDAREAVHRPLELFYFPPKWGLPNEWD